jgi:hypothetical protein
VEDELFPLLQAELCETFPESVNGSRIGASIKDDSNAIDTGLLRTDGEGRDENASCHSANELPPIHR